MKPATRRMACSSLLAALFFVCAMNTGRAEDPIPIGYVVDSILASEANEDEGADDVISVAELIRNGEKIEVSEGSEIFAGDVLSTDAANTIGIAFLDNSAVTLRPASTVRIIDYSYPARRAPTRISVEAGRAYFSVSPRPADAHFFVQMQSGNVEVKGTKFEVFHTKDGSGYISTVAVTKGAVTVVPNGNTATDIFSGSQLILKVISPNFAGATGEPMTINQKNLTKAEIKALDAIAISDIEVNVSKKGVIKIKSMNTNLDGTKSYIKMSEFNNKVVSSKTVIKNTLGKVISTISETKSGRKTKGVDGTLAIKTAQKTGDALGKVDIKDSATKIKYKGVLSTLADGTKVQDALSKTGARIVITEKINADGSVTRTVTKFDADATQGTQQTKTTTRDGAITTFSETVGNTLLPSGDFETIAPIGPVASVPPPPPGPPAIYTSGTTVIVPDTTPVSP